MDDAATLDRSPQLTPGRSVGESRPLRECQLPRRVEGSPGTIPPDVDEAPAALSPLEKVATVTLPPDEASTSLHNVDTLPAKATPPQSTSSAAASPTASFASAAAPSDGKKGGKKKKDRFNDRPNHVTAPLAGLHDLAADPAFAVTESDAKATSAVMQEPRVAIPNNLLATTSPSSWPSLSHQPTGAAPTIEPSPPTVDPALPLASPSALPLAAISADDEVPGFASVSQDVVDVSSLRPLQDLMPLRCTAVVPGPISKRQRKDAESKKHDGVGLYIRRNRNGFVWDLVTKQALQLA